MGTDIYLVSALILVSSKNIMEKVLTNLTWLCGEGKKGMEPRAHTIT